MRQSGRGVIHATDGEASRDRDQHRRVRGVLLERSAARLPTLRGLAERGAVAAAHGDGLSQHDVADAREPHDRRQPERARRGRATTSSTADARPRRISPAIRSTTPPTCCARRPSTTSRTRRAAHGGRRLARHAQRAHARLQPAVLQGPARVRDADGACGMGRSSRLGYPMDRQAEWAQLPKRFIKDAMVASVAAHVCARHAPDLLLDALPVRRQPPAPARPALAGGVLGARVRRRLDRPLPRGLSGESTPCSSVSDHGFLPSTREIRPNVRLRKLGAEREDALRDEPRRGRALRGSTAMRRAVAQLAAEIAKMEGVSGAWPAAQYATLGLPAARGQRARGRRDVRSDAGLRVRRLPRRVRTSTGTPKYLGNHGQRPLYPDNHALFVAAGPAIRRGVRLPIIRSRDVAPTVAAALGLALPPVEGVAVDGGSRLTAGFSGLLRTLTECGSARLSAPEQGRTTVSTMTYATPRVWFNFCSTRWHERFDLHCESLLWLEARSFSYWFCSPPRLLSSASTPCRTTAKAWGRARSLRPRPPDSPAPSTVSRSSWRRTLAATGRPRKRCRSSKRLRSIPGSLTAACRC